MSAVILAGCKDDRPEEILTEEKMTGILLDIYSAEGKVSSLNIRRDSALAIFSVYEQKIFEQHGVEKDRYKQSLSYYYNHPEQLGRIYEGVLDSLNIRDKKIKEPGDAREKMRRNRSDNRDSVESPGQNR
ncbi:MAG: DUF4296 domain-containing protein [Fulvivirga sp.]|nr:DUF4296 domain-containing protein [Fulvivirga sp.]